jgi:8-oxo-dGTP diphosphatase
MGARAGMTGDPSPDRGPPLTPGNAVAALIVVGERYLLQLRDDKETIFFPRHWGLFGGGYEENESLEQALKRELNEELELTVADDEIRYFTRFDFDLGFAGLAPIWRNFYEIDLPESRLNTLNLHEGSAMRTFSADDIMQNRITITPYDSFALWFHINRRRLVAQSPR